MRKFSRAQIAEEYGRIKSGGGDFFSNYCFPPDGADMDGVSSGESLLLFKSERDFVRLFFITRSLDNLGGLLDSSLPDGLCACVELASRGAPARDLDDFFKSRFRLHSVYEKMELARIPPAVAAEACGELAPEELSADMEAVFDKFSDHIPEISEISRFCLEKRAVSFPSQAGPSYVLFSIEGAFAYINFFANRAGRAGMERLWSGFYSAAALAGARAARLWVNRRNEKALAVYSREGFKGGGIFSTAYVCGPDGV